MLLGATYSHHEIDWLKLDPGQSFNSFLELDLDLVRLGVYWGESEPNPGRLDFGAINNLLTQCDKVNQRVMLTVGMKAPRWPEYHLPAWLKATSPSEAAGPVLDFIAHTVDSLKSHPSLEWWQVENEPLSHSGPDNWSISKELLEQEIKLVRRLDPDRKIHLNLWGDNVIRGAEAPAAMPLADSVGVDIYFKQPLATGHYHGPGYWDWQLGWWMKRQPKPVWFTEMQAEPWERHDTVKFSANPSSLPPAAIAANLRRALKLHPSAVLLWGVEYWLWQRQQGRLDWWDTARQAIKEARSSPG